MERRHFLKSACSLCTLVGVGLIVNSLSSCSQLPIYKTAITENKISIPVSLFTQNDLRIVRPIQLDYDIALQKETDGTYTALLLRCTHADNQLTSTGNGFACNLHGSKFDKEGKVTKGPAEHSLRRFTTKVDSDIIIINLNS
jgi:Rieske Fe-S protein